MMEEKNILRTLINKEKNILPVWIMRQAGRYLPEYREVRAKISNFLDLCYNANLASEVTLQPITRFGFDAAIIFSDILVIPDALGSKVSFVENEGPRIEKINSIEEFNKLSFENYSVKLSSIYQAIDITRQALPKNKALIGFVGAPWTIATYMVQGKSSKDFSEAKIIAYQSTDYFDKLINMLVEAIIIHISKQIEAGAEIIQIFDSWAGILDEYLFHKFVLEPTLRIVNSIKKLYPKTPIIGFPKGAGIFYKKYIEKINIDAIGLDSSMSIGHIRDLNKDIVIQGNLDPSILFADKSVIRYHVMKILELSKDTPFIFNLGHGILPKTPIDNVYYLMEIIKDFRI